MWQTIWCRACHNTFQAVRPAGTGVCFALCSAWVAQRWHSLRLSRCMTSRSLRWGRQCSPLPSRRRAGPCRLLKLLRIVLLWHWTLSWIWCCHQPFLWHVHSLFLLSQTLSGHCASDFRLAGCWQRCSSPQPLCSDGCLQWAVCSAKQCPKCWQQRFVRRHSLQRFFLPRVSTRNMMPAWLSLLPSQCSLLVLRLLLFRLNGFLRPTFVPALHCLLFCFHYHWRTKLSKPRPWPQ